MFRRAGIQAVELNVIQPVHIHGEGKLMAPDYDVANIRPQ